MTLKYIVLFCAAALVAGCATSTMPTDSSSTTLAALQKEAAKFNGIIAVPSFETTTNALAASVKATIARGNAALDRIGQLQAAQVNFTNTVRALDDMGYDVGLMENRLSVIEQTSTNEKLRDAATEQIKVIDEWSVGIDYREDVYRSLKAYAETHPVLTGEDARLFEDTMRDYRRAGLDLPKPQRDEVEALRKKLSGLTTDFEANVTKAQQGIKFTKADLEGVSDDFLNSPGVKTGSDEYTVMANITWHAMTVLENAKREPTRMKVEQVRDSLAVEKNVPLLQQILALRDEIAQKLGYKTWADFQIEVKMAKNADTAEKFLEDLKKGLQPKFDAEVAEFRALKVKETGDPNAQIHLWDWRYYANQLKKEKYTVDEDALKVYFPYQHVLQGMFDIYQKIFGIRIQEIAAPYKWVSDLKLYAVTDSASGEPLGLFYLDMFPREGKYNHFAQFGIIEGKLLEDGRYQRPTVALICNFPAPSKDKPSLMSHNDVETIFHEFGHALHSILTRAKYSRFAGTSVPGDFVEAPSQMLENWPWDKKVLDSFAADYRDPSKKIPQETLDKLKEARLATMGNFYRRQLSFGLTDMALHTQIHAGNEQTTVALANQIAGDTFYPEPPNTAYVAYFGHLMGYDAGYYGYAWADAIAADMDTVFENAPNGHFDTDAGMKLRKEIYEVGNSRDVNVSIEKFLGRPRSLEPFLKKIGVNSGTANK